MKVHFIFMFLFLQTNLFKAKNPRHDLLEALFGNDSYKMTRDIIPLSPGDSAAIHVHFEFDVHQILGLNEKRQVMKLNIWLRMKWKNIFLKWNPDDYEGVKKITVDKDKVWVPDLTLWNRAVNDASIYHRIDTRIVLEHDGKCSWYGPVTTSSTCSIRVQYFPFDNQTCTLKFGSWRHTTEEIMFTGCQNTCADTKYFKPNNEWSLVSAYGEIRNHSSTTGEYSMIDCHLALRRKSMFYVMNMVVPCTIIALLSCLTFYLPANNGERASLVITVLLAMTVYMLMVADSMPPTSEAMPLVQKFYLVTIFETAFCLLATCTVVKWHESTSPMPQWIFLVFNCYLRKLMHVKYVGQQGSSTVKDGSIPVTSKESRSVTHQTSRINSDASEVFPLHHHSFTIQENVPVPDVAVASKDPPEENDYLEVPRDWKLAARVLNKVFLVLFIAIFVLSITAIFAGVNH